MHNVLNAGTCTKCTIEGCGRLWLWCSMCLRVYTANTAYMDLDEGWLGMMMANEISIHFACVHNVWCCAHKRHDRIRSNRMHITERKPLNDPTNFEQYPQNSPPFKVHYILQMVSRIAGGPPMECLNKVYTKILCNTIKHVLNSLPLSA